VAYQDGHNCYGAYFVPSATDPMGMWMYVDNIRWRAEKGDTFEQLIYFINYYWGKELTDVNASCIVPEPDSGSDVKDMKKKWRAKKPSPCGVYNVANLMDVADGGELRASIGADANNFIATASVFYHASNMSGGEFAARFAQQSQTGRTPLSSVILIGHGRSGGHEIGGDGSNRFNPLTFAFVTIAGQNTAFAWRPWERAINWNLSMGCWLRTDATARFVGCNTQAMARFAAANVMRGRSMAYGTTTFSYAKSNTEMGWGKQRNGFIIVQDTDKPTATSESEYHSHDWWVGFEGEN